MARTNKRGDRRTCDFVLFKADALVSFEDRIGATDLTIPFADSARHSRDFVAAVFAIVHLAAQMDKSLFEKALNVVRLQAPGACAVHVLTNACDLCGCDMVVDERLVFEKL